MTTGRFMRGAKPSPRHKLLATQPHRARASIPAQLAWVPQKLDMWGNDTYGDCVTAEEAFAKACHSPEFFIDPQTAIAWARSHGYLDGANLTDVMDSMQRDGFSVSGTQYDDGPYQGVDYSSQPTLQSAVSLGPVKVAIDANALPQTAGSQQGWHATGGSPGQFANTDHCVSVCGYGPAGWLYQQLGVPLPSGVAQAQAGYLVFTWSSIGFVDHAWIMSTVVEAWLRSPTTLVVGPAPPPTPGPTPQPQPTPAPQPLFTVSFGRAVRQGGPVAFRAPVPIPAGVYGVVSQTPHASVENEDEAPE